MTGIVSRKNKNPLSRVTVASLEDMGYTVDYANADAFTTEDLNPSCLCRRRRNLWDGEHGEVLMMDTPEKQHNLDSKPLREDLRQYAIQYGREVLQESASASAHVNDSDGGPIYVGDQQVSIIMIQDGELYSVIVTL